MKEKRAKATAKQQQSHKQKQISQKKNSVKHDNIKVVQIF